MKAAIIAAGKGRRLASFKTPKALIKVHGEPLIARTLARIERAGYTEILCVIRKDDVRLEAFLRKWKGACPLKVIKRNSRNPFYSTMAVKDAVGDEGVVVFNVDACFEFADLKRFTRRIKDVSYRRNKDMVMWATRDRQLDDNPAYIQCRANGQVVDYGKDIERQARIFGQIRYISKRGIKDIYPQLVNSKIHRIKHYILHMIKRGLGVYVHDTRAYVFDIDTPQDYDFAHQQSVEL